MRTLTIMNPVRLNLNRPLLPFFLTLAFLSSLTNLSGCATTTQAGAVGADRKQLLLVSSEQLEKLATQSYNQLQANAAKKGVLNTNAELTQRVRRIGQNIIPSTSVFRRDAPAWKWEINVIESKDLNAFCMPGGKIIFYSGIINQLQLSDDEIAIVMGHEIAHALREHSREQVSQAIAADTALNVGAALFGLSQNTAKLTATAYQALLATKFSRTDETEADQIGLELSARSGYDPRAGVTLWQKMLAANKGQKPPEFMSTHPAEKNRVQEIQSLLPRVMPLYEAARRGS